MPGGGLGADPDAAADTREPVGAATTLAGIADTAPPRPATVNRQIVYENEARNREVRTILATNVYNKV